jgi:DNA uptake protein ComE-like DNA-binding protein
LSAVSRHVRVCGRARRRCQRGFILPVVLALIGLLAVTMAGFVFFVRAETAGTFAYADGQQARLVAESGLEEVISVLREGRDNSALWFDVPERFWHALVWAESYDRDSDPLQEETSRREMLANGQAPTAAWRYSVVAETFDGLPDIIRFGITPEAGKLNLNTASEEQITELLNPLLVGLGLDNPQELINALLDWRDEDDTLRDDGAESQDHYNLLEPAYSAKNGRFDTVEELLLVKGFSAAILYGEDVNRNGVLDVNEDDGDATFPYYDNQDGDLDRGIAPFLTVWSRELDTASDNKARINLNADAITVGTQLEQYFQEGELSDATLEFLGGLKGSDFNFSQIGSPAELYQRMDEVTEEGEEGAGSSAPAELADSPVTLEELPYIVDYLSTRSSEDAEEPIEGLININTAPIRVLVLIPGMTSEAAAAIVDTRQQADADSLRTTAWPLVLGAVDLATFHAIAPYITTKAYQFHVEVLGYADHLRISRRYEWVIELVGPLAQIKYHRDLTSLGPAWPIDDETRIAVAP